MRIETATDFLASVNEGDVLYQLHSWHCEPTHIECITVVRVENETLAGIFGGEPNLRCYYVNARGTESGGYVGDMLNQWHGVWTDLQEALDYFNERRAAYKTDPALIAEQAQAVADARRYSSWGF